MTEEVETASAEAVPVQEVEEVVSENASQESESKRVPVEALIAERRKRQEMEAHNKFLQEQLMRTQNPQSQTEPEEDETELVSKGDLKKFRHMTKEEFTQMKREIAEETFKESNPEAIRLINAHLKEIVEKKPWLAQSIEQATNRYARAYEIVQDYAPQLKRKVNPEKVQEKIETNSKKPGSPAALGKSSQLSQADYMKSIAGTKEFREYRQKLLGR